MNKIVIKSAVLLLPLSISSAFAIDSISHDEVEPITDSVVEELHSKFMPWLNVEHGCDYQAAINNDGEVSAGLEASGRTNGDCESMDGQVYAKSSSFSDGTTAIMYAYYFAKDHAYWGGLGGHRHDWENVIVWIDEDENIIGAAYSSHGDYSTTTSPLMIDTNIVAKYSISYTTHSLFEADSTDSIGQENLVSYDNLSATIQANLDENDWGSAVFPLKESSFSGYIEESRPFEFPYSE